MATMISSTTQWFARLFQGPTPALHRSRLRPDDSDDNPLMLQFFTWDHLHESLSWWKHFEDEVPRLARMGFTQVWLPPPNKAAEPKGRGYDAYDLWDLGEFDQKGTTGTRWGTREEYLSACKVAKEHGIDVIVDAVLNHKLGADKVETFPAVPVRSDNRLKVTGPARDIEGWTVFDFPGRGDNYSKFKWNQTHFTGVDWDEKTRTGDIFRIEGPGHKGWSRNVDHELGNYDFLLGIDIDHRHPDVEKDLIDWGEWILKTTGSVGFRLDAIKHVDRKFTLKFLQTLRERPGNDKMMAVSEYWSGNLKAILPYIKAFKGETAFFDVPLHMKLCTASKQRTRYDLRTILKDTIVSVKPGDAVTFVDNHDTVEGQSLESWVENNFKVQAYALILLRSYGYPCVFYGDLYPNELCYNENIERNLTLLIEARKKFAYGATVDYLDDRNCIGFVRKGDEKHPGCAVILSNKEDNSGTKIQTIRMNVGIEHASSTYRSFMTQHGRTEIDAKGWGEFSCFANHVQIWVKLEEEPATDVPANNHE